MTKYKGKKQIKAIISWVAVLVWMALIFNLSSQVAERSNQLSTGITEIIVKTVEKVAPETNFNVESFNHILRKNAHFFAYLFLGMLVLNALRRSGFLSFKGIILALLICILYAISDEVHQAFVPGRGPQVKDVLIDSAGAVVGIGMYLGMSRIKKKIIRSRYLTFN